MVLTIKDNNSQSGIVYSGLFGKLANQKDENSWYNKSQNRLSEYYGSLIEGEETEKSKKLLKDLKNIDKTTYDIIQKSKDHDDALKNVNQSMTTMSGNFDTARLKAIAFNTAVNIGVAILGTLVTIGVQKLLDNFKSAEEKAESAAEALQKYSDAQDKIKSNQSTINGFTDDYTKLSKGVNSLGENVSLSSDEYERFLDISNQIAEMFPDLVSYYDSAGNAVLTYGTSIDTLNEKLKENAQLSAIKLWNDDENNAQDVIDTLQNKLSGEYNWSQSLWLWINKITGTEEQAKKAIDKAIKNEDKNRNSQYKDLGLIDKQNALRGLLSGLSSETALNDFISNYKGNIEDLKDYLEDELKIDLGWDFEADDYDILHDKLSDIQTLLNSVDGEIKQQILDAKKLATAYPQMQDSYWSMTEEQQNAINAIYNNLGDDFYKKVAKGEINYETAFNEIFNALKDTDNLNVLELTLEASTKWNDNKLSYDDWHKKVQALLTLFKGNENITNSIKTVFDFEDLEGSYKRAVDRLRSMDGAGGLFTGDGANGSINANDVFGQLNQNQIEHFLDKNVYNKVKKWCNDNKPKNASEVANYIEDVISEASSKTDYGELFDDLDDVGGGLSVLSKAFGELRDKSKVTLSTLKDIYEKFKSNPEINNYIQKLSKAKGNTEETNKVLGALTEYQIKEVVGVNNLTEANRGYIESLLKENDVANASVVAAKMIADAKAELAVQTKDTSDKTWNSISSLYKEAGYSSEQIDSLIGFKKQLAGNKIKTVEDCNNLVNLATKAGLAAKSIEKLYKLKKLYTQLDNLESQTDTLTEDATAKRKTANETNNNNSFGIYNAVVEQNAQLAEKKVADNKNKIEKKKNQISKIVDSFSELTLDGKTKYNPKKTNTGKSETETDFDSLKKKYEANEITLDEYIAGLKKLLGKAKKGSDLYNEIKKELNSQNLNNLNNKYERSEINENEYIKGLKKELKNYKKGTEGYKEILQKIKEAQKSKLDGQFERGEISSQKYIKGLAKLRDSYRVNTKAWKELNDKVINAKKDQLDNQLERGEISYTKYIQKLQALRGAYKENTEGWKKLNDEIVKAQDTQLENQFERGEITYKQYINALYQQLNEYEIFSDKWQEITNKIQNAQLDRLDAQYDRSEITSGEYIAGLLTELSTMIPGTEEYQELVSKILDQVFTREQNRLENGEITEDEYIAWLRDYQNKFKKGSDKYNETGQEIQEREYERDSDFLEKSLNLNLISEEEYYRKKIELSKSYYEKNKSFNDEYADDIAETYQWLADQYKENLEEQKDALTDFYDKQKELLQDQSDNDDYLKEQGEKRKNINSLKAEITALEKDTSDAARKRIDELRSQLSDAEDELAEYEKDRALELTLASLEEAEADSLAKIDNKVNAIEKNTSGIYEVIAAWGKEKYGISLPSASVVASYASGTSSSVGGLVTTQENKLAELIGMNTGSGTFTMLTPSSKVWNNEATEFLYKFANNPTKSLLEKLGESTNSIAQNITTVNNSSEYNINIQKGAIIVQGNADKQVLDNATKDLAYNLLTEFKRLK